MKKKTKLVLDRETITSLQSDALDAVAGGVLPSGCVDISRVTGTLHPGCGGGASNVTSQLLGCGNGGGLSRQISLGGK